MFPYGDDQTGLFNPVMLLPYYGIDLYKNESVWFRLGTFRTPTLSKRELRLKSALLDGFEKTDNSEKGDLEDENRCRK